MRFIQALLFQLFIIGAANVFTLGAADADLPLPPAMIALGSPAGQTLFAQATAKQSYWPLSAHYESQENQAFCGIASLVIVLNSLNIAAPQPAGFAPYHFFTQDDLFAAGGSTIFQPQWIEHHGLTLDQLGQIATHFGLVTQVVHATPEGLQQFRRRAARALATQSEYVLVNFKRTALDEQGYGHISPLAAYDAKSDRFLILDVARYKYPPAWVTAKNLYRALDTPDPGNANQTRGYLIIR
jgi:hypothetical protein